MHNHQINICTDIEIHCYSWRCSDKKTHFHWVMVQEHQLLTLGFAFGKTNILIINHIACFCIFILYEWHVLKINKNGFRKCMFLLLVSIYICGIYSGCHASKHSLMAISIEGDIRYAVSGKHNISRKRVAYEK